jgi:hypothetical protein
MEGKRFVSLDRGIVIVVKRPFIMFEFARLPCLLVIAVLAFRSIIQLTQLGGKDLITETKRG